MDGLVSAFVLGCWVASLACMHQMPAAPPHPFAVWKQKIICGHCQMSAGGGHSSPVGATTVDISENSREIFFEQGPGLN